MTTHPQDETEKYDPTNDWLLFLPVSLLIMAFGASVERDIEKNQFQYLIPRIWGTTTIFLFLGFGYTFTFGEYDIRFRVFKAAFPLQSMVMMMTVVAYMLHGSCELLLQHYGAYVLFLITSNGLAWIFPHFMERIIPQIQDRKKR